MTGNQIVAYDCDDTMTACDLFPGAFPVSQIEPDSVGTTTFVFPFAPEQGVGGPVDLPAWATTFAEERFASIDEQPLEDTTFYVSVDPENVLPGATQSDYTFGGHPSLIIDGLKWHSKFVATHEAGHLQTLLAAGTGFSDSELNYCHDESDPQTVVTNCTPNHTFFSHEWQGAAAIEGFAHWYAVSMWNDVDYVDAPGWGQTTRYVLISDASNAQALRIPADTGPFCIESLQLVCGDGASIEYDWVSALRQFRLDATPTPSFRTMFTMLSAYHGSGTWVTADPSDGFWTNFDQSMSSHLGPLHDDWVTAAQLWELDR